MVILSKVKDLLAMRRQHRFGQEQVLLNAPSSVKTEYVTSALETRVLARMEAELVFHLPVEHRTD